jgi:polar amino acid transport system substrate-binding protein
MRSDGVITDVSRSLAESLGYRREEVIGRPTGGFIVADEREEQIRRLARRFMNEQTEQVEVRVNSSDGSVRTILFSAGQAVLHESGTPDTVLVTGIDITDRKAAEALARLREQELVHADKMASLGILVSGVAHEINNPNNFIILNADNLADVWKDAARMLDKIAADGYAFTLAGISYPEVRDEVPRLITGIGDGAKRIRNIVLNLKDFARPQTPTMDEWVNFDRVLEAATTILANLIRKSTDHFELRLEQALPAIKGNFQKIEQVVINLLTNACQALADRARGIRVATFSQADRVVLEICDEGVGIPADHLTHIFDPFFTTKRDSGGTGLGLSISYSIVKEHGGELTITSQSGVGTTARVSLPLATATQGVSA